MSRGPRLKPEEKEACLRLLGEGRTYREVASIINRSEQTCRNIDKANKKNEAAGNTDPV
jgi:DNA-binding CsgD family transcriptional regulator